MRTQHAGAAPAPSRRGAGLTDPLAAVRQALAGEPAWIVGGAVRDRLLGRATDDLDLAVAGEPAGLARQLARECAGTAFPLSDRHAAWRVTGRRGGWHVDLMAIEGSIEDDLARRDFTINAIAEPLAGGPAIDPHGGRADLDAGRLRMVAARRLRRRPPACAARRAAGRRARPGRSNRPPCRRPPPARRAWSACRRSACLPSCARSWPGVRPRQGLELMEALGATALVLPEVAGLRGVAQSDYHHLDVHEHTLAVLDEAIAIERDPEPALGEHAGAVAALLDEPLADELTRGGCTALRGAAARRGQAGHPRTGRRRPGDLHRP